MRGMTRAFAIRCWNTSLGWITLRYERLSEHPADGTQSLYVQSVAHGVKPIGGPNAQTFFGTECRRMRLKR